ncbi:hypothetical protein PGT21_003492 [Puccinia graminis f. sp. tritici]|uniref:Uncharacterized protein n=1 Tax=Puccinia graminis f. sp. tritici TaxID=56615 RepID=A0A5B0QMC3_PUCGR|nr:hypothetical protein PGT21_003492 [Puccinia graminis f. sp. tritici]
MFLQDDPANEPSSPVPHEDQSLPENDSTMIHDIDQGVMQLPSPGRLNVVPRVAQDLLGRINFSAEDVELINELLMVPQFDQWRVSVILMLANLRRVGMRTDAEAPAPTEALLGNSFVFSNTIHNFFRIKIRELLTRGGLEAYARTHTMGGLPIARSPLSLLTTYLEEQPQAFREDYLPQGWPMNHLANQSMLTLMRVLVKHERGSLRNLEFNRRAINGPVPNLSNLILLIDRAMGDRDHLRPLQP